MSKKMLINATLPEEHRVAIVEDGVLSELDIEITGKEQTKGNIYKAVVVRVETGLQAAFVDYGGERPGFLQIGEIHPSFHSAAANGEAKGRPRINDLLRRGQELLVQVVKEERGTKGAALTTYLSLPGRYMVLMPESDTKGISRKIEQESTRKKLKQAMNSLELPENVGYIVRTAGIGQKKTELKRDVDYLLRVYEKILELGKQVKAPALVYKESNLVIRSIRDYFSPDIDEVLVDDPKAAQEGKDFFEEVMPEYAQLVKLHQERRPIFSRYQIEEQIEGLSRNKVSLPSGGSIVIDTTEALVAIDVNSGKMATEKGVEATAFKSNMEAAAEAARQLRLRDLGGLIVIDFIDMRDRKHIRDVEKCLKEALKSDKARVSVGRISQFGLLEMSRQRIKAALAEASYLPCPHCEGSGRIKSAEAQALTFIRRVSAGMAKGQIGRVEGQVPLEVAAYLLNNKRAELTKLERQYNATIYVKGFPELTNGQIEVEFFKREKEEQKSTRQYVEASSGRNETQADSGGTAEDVEEAAKPEAEEAGRSSRKRRRPRRRRKPAGATADKAAEGTTSPEGEAVAQPKAEPQPASAAQPATGGETPPAQTEEISPPASTDAGSAAAEPAPADSKAPAASTAASLQQEEAPASDKGEKKPKPRRRRPSAAKKTDTATETAGKEVAETAAEPTHQEKEAAAAPEAEPVKPKTPRRRRTSPAKKAAAESSDKQPAEAASPSGATAEPKDQAKAEEEKPKRRRPRKTAAKKPEADAVEKTASTGDAEAGSKPADDAAAEAEPAKKPARRGRPRKKPVTEESPSTAEEKPKPKRKPRKKAAAEEPGENKSE